MNPFSEPISGIQVFLKSYAQELKGLRISAVVHAASRTADGTWTPDAMTAAGLKPVSLMGPEHGIESLAGAGENLADGFHPRLDCPVVSLYGDTRKPLPEHLENVDAVLFDLQDLGVRCYTYVSTLQKVMESCSELGKILIVTDRPVPFMNTVDGPLTDFNFRSFVADIPAPLIYGMTPGETARWLQLLRFPDLDLRIAPCAFLHRDMPPEARFKTWNRPSPALPDLESALRYPSTVWTEAIPQIDAGRKGKTPFQQIGSPSLRLPEILEHLRKSTPDAEFSSTTFAGADGARLEGIGLPHTPNPVALSLHLLEAIQTVQGKDWLWESEGVRPEWFDKLMGTDQPRLALQAGKPVTEITSGWQDEQNRFLEQRKAALLYPASDR